MMSGGFTARMMTVNEVVDELTYRSYAYQRFLSPETPAEDWARIFGDRTQQECEARLVAELSSEVEN